MRKRMSEELKRIKDKSYKVFVLLENLTFEEGKKADAFFKDFYWEAAAKTIDTKLKNKGHAGCGAVSNREMYRKPTEYFLKLDRKR